MAVSEWFSDEELISQLSMFFSADEQLHIDFQALLGQIVEVDDRTREIKIKGRVFRFDLQFCDVEEVE